jgi:peptidoglycan L-alanyl-D-glutamate endopeptidase CwlK
MTDRTEELIAELDWYTASSAVDLINRLRRAGYPAVITSARRSPQEQKTLLQQGRTTTLRSKHLTGQAFDVDMYGWNRDRVPAWAWDVVGPAGEASGLKWGGRWKSFRDVGHFER